MSHPTFVSNGEGIELRFPWKKSSPVPTAGTKIAVAKENAGAISLLAHEFGLEELLSDCSAFQRASAPELIALLSERISKLASHKLSYPRKTITELKERIENRERQLETLNWRPSALVAKTSMIQTDLNELKPGSGPLSTPTLLSSVFPSRILKELPPVVTKSLDGIISYLTRKHGGKCSRQRNCHNYFKIGLF
jgi:hypothetical protein